MIKGKLSEHYLELGKVVKPYGKDGWIKVNLNTDYIKILKKQKFVFMVQWGSYVPYFIEDNSEIHNNLMKFEGIEGIESVQALNGMSLYINEIQYDPKQLPQSVLLKDLEDYTVYNRDEIIGKIESIDEYPMQLMATIGNDHSTYLVPLNSEFVQSIDDINKIVNMSLPYGLLEI
ncbi:MAG: ribosome maturation factor RimM [Saprospiraceae bacterium]